MTESRSFQIQGIDCADCARSIEQGVAALPGVNTCTLNFAAARLDVEYRPETLAPPAIVERIAALGYRVEDDTTTAATGLTALLPIGWQFFAGGAALLLLGVLAGLSGAADAAHWLEIGAVLVGGFPIARSGLRALLLSRRMTINLLMTLAAIGAVFIGETVEAAAVIVLFALGEALEGFTIQRGRNALRSLLKVTPDEATVLVPCTDCAEHHGRDGYTSGPCPWCGTHEQKVPAASVRVGDLVLVRPGERVPLDGTIERGMSALDQRAITGESIPVPRGPGDGVFAGSVNGSAALEIRATAPASDSLMSRVAALVEEAQTRRAPVERQIDRFAAIYTPAVVAVAVLVATVPPLAFAQPFWDTPTAHGWLYRALALLIAACPCALVISTPVTIVSALTAATRAGVLLKGGAVLESLRRIRTVAFDKTGTLTQGQPQVTGVFCADGCCASAANCAHCDDVLALADAVERRSAHPLAHAVTSAATARPTLPRYAPADGVDTLIGQGVVGRVHGNLVTVGSHALFDQQHQHEPALCAQIADAEARGQTALLVCSCDQGGVQGYITVADTPRPESSATLAALRKLGIRSVMLTGDNPTAGAAIARAVGADDVRASLLPADKLAAIHELRRTGGVAMVGDGINDTPALAAADVGIAMGAGSAQALQTADATLMHNDLSRLPFLLQLSQRTGAIIRQNITFSLVTKVLVLALALGGWASLWLAVLADVGASLLVTLNGMRAGRQG